MRFRATIRLNGKTATGIRVPDAVVEALGGGKRPAVRVTVGDHAYRSTVAAMGGEFWLPFSAEQREASGLGAGDEVDVELVLDSAPRSVDVPDDLVAALDAEPSARATFDRISYSEKRWFVLGIEDAKTPGTRVRRIEKAIARLREGRGQR